MESCLEKGKGGGDYLKKWEQSSPFGERPNSFAWKKDIPIGFITGAFSGIQKRIF